MVCDITTIQLDTAPTLDDDEGDDELHDELQAADAAFRARQFDKAVEHLTTALEVAQGGVGAAHLYTVAILVSLARAHRALGNLDEVQSMLDSARESALGVLDRNKIPARQVLIYSEISRVLNMAALNYMTKGQASDYREAEGLLQQAVDMTQLINGDGHAAILNYLNHCDICVENVERLYTLQSKKIETEPLARLARELREDARKLHEKHPTVDDLCDQLRTFYTKQQKLEVLGPILRDALQITEDSLGTHHEVVASRQLAIAKVLAARGEYIAAEELCRGALRIKELWGITNGLGNLGVALARAELGVVLQKRDMKPEAEEMLESALNTASANLELYQSKNEGVGANRDAMLIVARCKTYLGLFYRQLGQVKTRPAPKQAFTEARVEIVDFYSLAEPHLEEALEILRQLHGEYDLRVAYAMGDLAVCYQLQGQVSKSEQLSQVAHGIIGDYQTMEELTLLRKLMAEGQGVVQQMLDEMKLTVKTSTKALAANRKEQRRLRQRQKRLKHKFSLEKGEQLKERERWQAKLKEIEGWGATSMRLTMKRDDATKRVMKEFEEVIEQQQLAIKDRKHLIRQKHKALHETEDAYVTHEVRIRAGRVQIDELEELLSQRYKKVIAKAFKVFDRDGSGALDRDELHKVLDVIEPDMELEKKIRLVEVADTDGDGQIDYEEFVRLLLRREVNFDELKKAFETFDTDGSGSLDHDECKALMLSVEPSMSLLEVEEIIQGVDADNDGSIDWKEFIFFMRSLPWRKAFKEADVDGGGTLDTSELYALIFEMNPDINPKQLEEMIAGCDEDNSGEVDYEEFFRYMKTRQELEDDGML